MASRFSTIDEVVAEASSIIPKATDEEKVLMRQWGYRAQSLLGFSKYNIQKSDKIYLTAGFAVAKPTDLIRTIDLALYDNLDREYRTTYKGWAKSADATSPQARIHEDMRRVQQTLQVSEDADYFYIQSFPTEDATVNYVYLKYYGLPLDGSTPPLPLIPEESVEACIMYLRWRISMRRQESASDQVMCKNDWMVAKSSARSILRTPDPILAREINAKANSMIQTLRVEDRLY